MLESFDGALTEWEAKQVFRDAGIPVVHGTIVDSPDEAVSFAEEVGYPVMLKIDSPDVQHKTDIGAVKDAHNAEEVRNRYELIMDAVKDHDPDAEIDGMLVEDIAEGHEMIIGVSKDPDFGHVIMFGLGGIFVEVLHDVHFRAIPLDEFDAYDLIEEMESKALLDGVRGQDPVDKDAIAETLLTISNLVTEHPEIETLDINPLFVNADGVIAADALMEVNRDE